MNSFVHYSIHKNCQKTLPTDGYPDPRNVLISLTYWARNEQLSIRNQLGYATSQTYDANGRNVWRQFANGDVTSMSFDNTGRQTLRQYADNTRVSLVSAPVENYTT